MTTRAALLLPLLAAVALVPAGCGRPDQPPVPPRGEQAAVARAAEMLAERPDSRATADADGAQQKGPARQ